MADLRFRKPLFGIDLFCISRDRVEGGSLSVQCPSVPKINAVGKTRLSINGDQAKMSYVEVLFCALTKVGHKPHKEHHNSCQYPIVLFLLRLGNMI